MDIEFIYRNGVLIVLYFDTDTVNELIDVQQHINNMEAR